MHTKAIAALTQFCDFENESVLGMRSKNNKKNGRIWDFVPTVPTWVVGPNLQTKEFLHLFGI